MERSGNKEKDNISTWDDRKLTARKTFFIRQVDTLKCTRFQKKSEHKHGPFHSLRDTEAFFRLSVIPPLLIPFVFY